MTDSVPNRPKSHDCPYYDEETHTCILLKGHHLRQLQLTWLIVGAQFAGLFITILFLVKGSS